MRIVSWNVNGIRAVDRKGLFIPMIRELRPDVLCLQETKAQQHQSPIDLPDYEEFWNSAEKKGYSGTAIFTKRKPLSVSYDIPGDITAKHSLSSDTYGRVNSEGRVISMEFPEVAIVTVYTPNAKDDLSRLELRYKHWDPAFLEHCVTLQSKKPVIFCGDLNVAHKEIDLAHPKENEGNKGFTKEEREGVDNLIKEGFVDTFRMFETGAGQYTWWSPWGGARERNNGWRIDYVFVSEQLEDQVDAASIHPEIFGSDHCPVSLDIHL